MRSYQIEEGSSKDVRSSIQKARENLQEAQQLLRETNIECRKKVASYCTLCQSIACEQITENCHLAMDKFKHYIGGSVNRFGKFQLFSFPRSSAPHKKHILYVELTPFFFISILRCSMHYILNFLFFTMENIPFL